MNKRIMKMFAIALSAISLARLTGCASLIYPDAGKYTAGDAVLSGPIEKIEIEWLSGSITVKTHKEETVAISEKAAVSLTDADKVHFWADGATLHIRFCESGRIPKGRMKDKALTVEIPETGALTELSVGSASADVSVEKVRTEVLKVSAASGDASVTGEARSALMDSASGSVTLALSGASDTVALDTASGRIKVRADGCRSLKAHTASGNISVSGAPAESLFVQTSSGDIRCELESLPEETDIDASSGSVCLILPSETGFTAKVDTASGDFSSGFALVRKGDTYIAGNGRARIKIDTASGDISIDPASVG